MRLVCFSRCTAKEAPSLHGRDAFSDRARAVRFESHPYGVKHHKEMQSGRQNVREVLARCLIRSCMDGAIEIQRVT